MCDALQLNWKLNPNVSGNMDHSGTVTGPKSAKSTKSVTGDKTMTLRACSIQKRMETETRKKQPKKRGPKPRPKSAPMSKYRRKTANQRERMRMGEINVAFEKLRDKGSRPFSRGGRRHAYDGEWPIYLNLTEASLNGLPLVACMHLSYALGVSD